MIHDWLTLQFAIRPRGAATARQTSLRSIRSQARYRSTMGQRPMAASFGNHVTGDLGRIRIQPLSAITSCLPGPVTTPPDHGRLGAGIMPGLAGRPQSTWGHEEGNGASKKENNGSASMNLTACIRGVAARTAPPKLPGTTPVAAPRGPHYAAENASPALLKLLIDAGARDAEANDDHFSEYLRLNLNLTPDQRRLTPASVATLKEDKGPSFTCSKARGLARAICSNAELATKDATLAALYRRELAERQENIVADQRDWLRMRDAVCTATNDIDTVACLLSQYRARIKVLQYSLNAPTSR
jgi:uncharacterized protein YecT (DUF1311 family)